MESTARDAVDWCLNVMLTPSYGMAGPFLVTCLNRYFAPQMTQHMSKELTRCHETYVQTLSLLCIQLSDVFLKI